MAMHLNLYLRDNIDKLYPSRKGGRGIANIANSINAPIRGLKNYIKKIKDYNKKLHWQDKQKQNNNK